MKSMKVWELIAKLQTCDQDAVVLIDGGLGFDLLTRTEEVDNYPLPRSGRSKVVMLS